jgi:hypothetical protein
MTRECDDSRHFADRQQQSSLTWDRVHSNEEYVRTSHNFGQQQFSAGLSFDLGGAQFDISTGNSYHRQHQWNQFSTYENGYQSGFYNSNGYQNYGQNYRGYNNGYDEYSGYGEPGRYQRGCDHSYRNAYGQIVPPRVEIEATPTSLAAERFYYEQIQNQQRYQIYGYQTFDPGYNGGYQNFDSFYTIADNPAAPLYANPGQYETANFYADDQYSNGPFGPTNNRFDLRYQGNRDSSSNDFYERYDRYNTRPDCDEQYIIETPFRNDYYSSYDSSQNGYGQYYGDRYSRNRYQQYRYPNDRYTDQYDSEYGANGYSNDYYPGQVSGDWMRMRATLQSMLGHSPREFNRNVSDDLGCATIVSAALRQAHGVNIHDTNVDGLENSLRRNGYEAVPIQYAQPGDCIIAHRYGNRHGHAAIFVGDGKVVNNSSAQGRVVVAPLNKFAARDYESVVAYRRI